MAETVRAGAVDQATAQANIAITIALTDPPQALRVLLEAMDIDVGAGRDHAARGVVERAGGAQRVRATA